MLVLKKVYEEKWIEHPEYPTLRVKIRPFPMSALSLKPGEAASNMFQMETIFKYCCIEWEGVLDEEEKPIPCTDENKQKVFDYANPIALWVYKAVGETSDFFVLKR
jgi:hypothetical protein